MGAESREEKLHRSPENGEIGGAAAYGRRRLPDSGGIEEGRWIL